MLWAIVLTNFLTWFFSENGTFRPKLSLDLDGNENNHYLGVLKDKADDRNLNKSSDLFYSLASQKPGMQSSGELIDIEQPLERQGYVWF